MAEVKALRLLNLSSHPLAEVSVVNTALSFLVLIYNKLGEVFEIKFLVLAAEESKYIFNGDKSVVVTIEVEECFADAGPVVGELDFDQFLQIHQSLLNPRLANFNLLLFCLLLLSRLRLLITLVVVLHLEILREEASLEGIYVHFMRSITVEKILTH